MPRLTLLMQQVIQEIASNPTWGYEVYQKLSRRQSQLEELYPNPPVSPFVVTLGGVYSAIKTLCKYKLVKMHQIEKDGRQVDQIELTTNGRKLLDAYREIMARDFALT